MAIQRRKIARIYKDFDLSFGANSITGDINRKIDQNAVKQSLKNLVLTKPYERPFNPELSSEVAGLLFENADIFTANRIRKTIEFLIQNYERRAKLAVDGVEVIPNEDKNTMHVIIRYEVVAINEPQELTILLERLR